MTHPNALLISFVVDPNVDSTHHSLFRTEPPLELSGPSVTLQEIITASPGVRDQAGQIPVAVEDDAIRPWTAAAVDLV
jgi:hypothetical protein